MRNDGRKKSINTEVYERPGVGNMSLVFLDLYFVKNFNQNLSRKLKKALGSLNG